MSYLRQLLLVGLCLTLSPVALAGDEAPLQRIQFIPSYSDFGGTGLMQMPTGRNAPEGEVSVGATWSPEYHHYSVAVQVFPWLEGVARYTLVQDLLYSNDPSFSREKYTDKGFDAKLRLLEEGYWLPETSVGLRDIGGTGLFDGEYVAATKRFGMVDLSLGMGWGYIGQSGNVSNPLCSMRDSFCERPTDVSGRGGEVQYDRWFKGNAALFGGVEYQTPWQPLRLKLEYDGNDYSQDFPVVRAGVDMSAKTPINLGVLYQPADWADFRLSYERGTTWVFGMNLRANYNQERPLYLSQPKPASRPSAPPPESLEKVNWPQLSSRLAREAGITDNQVVVRDDEVEVVGTQRQYRDRKEAYRQASRVMAEELPDSVDHYRITEQRHNMAGSSVVIDAEHHRKVADHQYIGADILDAATLEEPPLTTDVPPVADGREGFRTFAKPQLQQSFGGSESFYMYSLGVTGGADYQLTEQWQFGGSLYLNLLDNYDEFLYLTPPDGTGEAVPRVRTLVRQYIHDTPVRLSNLQLTWLDRLADGWYAQSYAGYLELMFAGAGGELLYRPLRSPWAVGVDTNYVVQRDPDSAFGVFEDEWHIDDLGRPYSVITGGFTGHLSLYYQPQTRWLDLDSTQWRLSAGQYLAGDKGLTLAFVKEFDSGVAVGVTVAKTNLSAEEYGEGSFNKSFYISIPFDLFMVRPTTTRGSLGWAPLNRDGGQELSRKYHLYGATDNRSPRILPFSSN